MPEITERTVTFTTTAMPRPEVVEQTYDSFSRNLLGLDLKQVRLRINIDRLPGGGDEAQRRQVADIARHYFGEVTINLPDRSNFAAAVRWCFAGIDTPFVCHLEDDWELLVPVNVPAISRMFAVERIQQVALRSRENVRQDFWLCPAFTRGAFCRSMAARMTLEENPEVEIRRLKNADPAYDPFCFVYYPFDFKAMIVRDLGRPWLKSTPFNRGATHFTTWSLRRGA